MPHQFSTFFPRKDGQVLEPCFQAHIKSSGPGTTLDDEYLTLLKVKDAFYSFSSAFTFTHAPCFIPFTISFYFTHVFLSHPTLSSLPLNSGFSFSLFFRCLLFSAIDSLQAMYRAQLCNRQSIGHVQGTALQQIVYRPCTGHSSAVDSLQAMYRAQLCNRQSIGHVQGTALQQIVYKPSTLDHTNNM